VKAVRKTANFSVHSPRPARQFIGVIRYRTVLFDLDGTLIDHFAAIHRTHVQTMAEFGLPPPTLDQVRRAVGGGLDVAVKRLFGEKNAAYWDAAIPAYRKNWPNNLLFEVKLLPGARELLAAINTAGGQSAVYTNKHGPSARAVLEHLGVAPLLAGIFGAFDTPYLKPQLEFSQHVLQALHAKTNESCLVGDSTYDIQTGKNAGFPCYCVTTGTHSAEELKEAEADGVYPDLASLGRGALGL
jgi:phosphoglycolate phosphatase